MFSYFIDCLSLTFHSFIDAATGFKAQGLLPEFLYVAFSFFFNSYATLHKSKDSIIQMLQVARKKNASFLKASKKSPIMRDNCEK